MVAWFVEQLAALDLAVLVVDDEHGMVACAAASDTSRCAS